MMTIIKKSRRQKVWLIALAGAILLSFAISIKPENSRPLVSAHRGASRQAPENTLAAFQLAMDMKADFVEVDIRTTSDGTQVCLHDRSLKRTTGVDKPVKDQTIHDLQGLSAGQWFDQKFKKEKVPVLDEVCALVSQNNKASAHYCRLYVDCKDIIATAVVKTLARYALLDSAVFYGDEETLLKIRKEHAAARLMPSYPGADKVRAIMLSLKPYAFDMAWREITPERVTQCHAAGIRVFTDLLGEDDTKANYEKAMDVNVDLIQTDDVAAVHEAMIQKRKH
ncbi:glycerophosphodiester phosphodiesterase [Chryseolinea soli]|uniref:Glycerophosphodiester phosphodiesterase n=1 Tax=Chryseolinea soli TaxID=2321403 RepID=A0A385SNN5_9BACT|nr:glycerophosphodiester phosphodiesterase family protein [Chryseolinea soli]AYB31555.1 glycerophosphodiester phosphodiesterase [Chryseolinea soli]